MSFSIMGLNVIVFYNLFALRFSSNGLVPFVLLHKEHTIDSREEICETVILNFSHVIPKSYKNIAENLLS